MYLPTTFKTSICYFIVALDQSMGGECLNKSEKVVNSNWQGSKSENVS